MCIPQSSMTFLPPNEIRIQLLPTSIEYRSNIEKKTKSKQFVLTINSTLASP